MPKRAIEGPIKIYAPPPRMSQHPHEPIFHCAAVKVFSDVEDFQIGQKPIAMLGLSGIAETQNPR
jgi:hypothetical protein